MRILGPIADREMPIEKFPDGTASLLLRILGEGRGDLSVAGPRTRALFKNAPPSELAILVQFRAGGALPLFGVPLNALTDRIVRLDELWGSDAMRLLESLLVERRDPLRALEAALAERVMRAEEPASVALSRRAVRRLSARADVPKIETLAADLGVTPRHLRRAFREAVGIGPKDFVRMLRLHRALSAAASRTSWSEVAVTAGYYDQSHLISEFRELVGVTPAAFAARNTQPALRW